MRLMIAACCCSVIMTGAFAQSAEQVSGTEMAQRRKLVKQAEQARKINDLTAAEAAYAGALAIWHDKDVATEHDMVLIQLGDTVRFCQVAPTGRSLTYPDGSDPVKELCIRKDSVPFEGSGLDPLIFSGIRNVSRTHFRADGRTVFGLYDDTDSMRVGFIILGSDTTYYLTDEIPVYPGGTEAMHTFLNETIHPTEAKSGGKVHVTFTIDRSGRVRDAKVSHSTAPALDSEALRAVNAMPQWEPGRFRGRPVDFSFVLPVRLKLD